MYDRIKIKGFRCFEEFEAQGLTRVNLLVGRNNSGKTAFLEAVELATWAGRLASVLHSPIRRGEIIATVYGQTEQAEVEMRHLFLGHVLAEGQRFEVRGLWKGAERWMSCQVTGASALTPGVLTRVSNVGSLELRVEGSDPSAPGRVVLTSRGGVVNDEHAQVQRYALEAGAGFRLSFLTTEGAELSELRQIWDELVLTPESRLVLEATRLVEPEVEDFAFTNPQSNLATPLFFRLKGVRERIPAGNLGAGVLRVLGISMHAARTRPGVLLIDELDTGLHYSTLQPIWRFLIETARDLDFQLFATTHSQDCIRALAWLQQESPELAGDVSVYHLDRGAKAPIRFSAEEIDITERHDMEIR